MTAVRTSPGARSPRRRRRTVAIVVTSAIATAIATAGCQRGQDDNAIEGAVGTTTDDDTSIEFRNGTGPRVDAPDRAMAMTVDAVETRGDDILVRIRVENANDAYLDMGVEDTIYGPLLVMHDDRGNRYDSYAVEPAGVPDRRVADLSVRLVGPLDPDAESFTLELTTQRGPLMSPARDLPEGDGVRWQVDGPAGSDPAYAAAPRLPDLIHFWLETDPMPAGS